MTTKLLILSLPYILSILPISAHAAIRVGNLSRNYADSYNQVNAMRTQQEYNNQIAPEASAASLPVRVANEDLANRIARGDTTANVGIENLEACASIYPNGTFAWDKPTAGYKIGAPSTCVATVEMRLLSGSDDILLARANIAAGDSIKCNISEFPEATYTTDTYNTVFPSDIEPTIDDVVKVMNEEQKKNAGIKIAAGAVIGALGGNAAGKNELGKEGILGGGKSKTQGALIGAVTGAGLMAGNSYAGKVGGDVILSTGVNAAMGGIMGNMLGGGNDVLRIEDCTDLNGSKTKCLWGVIEKYNPLDNATEIGFYNISSDTDNTVVCKKTDLTGCQLKRLIGVTFEDYASIEAGRLDNNFSKIRNSDNLHTYNATTRTISRGYAGDANGIWIQIKDGGTPTKRVAAMIPDYKDKAFGSKMSDWYKWRTNNTSTIPLGRNNLGEATKLPAGEKWSVNDFYPLTISANDGGIIDINNKARLGGTLTGAATGAGLGALSSYQGAQGEVEQRWVTSVQEYKDSLQKIYCATGTRFLSSYNDIAIIPNMSN